MITSASAPARPAKKISVRETAVLLVLAWLIPFVVHLAPWSGARPLGAYLLPMFWTTFVAVYFYGAGIGLLTALFAPATNLLMTGLPAWRFLSVMSLELVIFALVLAWAVRRAPNFWLLAPLGYLVAKAGSTLLQVLTPLFGAVTAPLHFFATSIAGVAVGLVVLAVINFVVVKFYPQDAVSAQ